LPALSSSVRFFPSFTFQASQSYILRVSVTASPPSGPAVVSSVMVCLADAVWRSCASFLSLSLSLSCFLLPLTSVHGNLPIVCSCCRAARWCDNFFTVLSHLVC
jgi:hypothetical protein